MPNEIEIRVSGVDTSGPAMTSAAAGMKKVSSEAQKLDKEMAATRAEMRRLAEQIARTGDEAERADLQRKFGEQSKALAGLKRVRGALDDVSDGAKEVERHADQAKRALEGVGREAKAALALGLVAGAGGGRGGGRGMVGAGAAAGAGAGTSFGEMLSGAVPKALANPAIAVGVSAAVTAALPAIGAMVSAAVLGGVGAGGILGGVMLAAKDSRVEGAFADLGKTIMTDLSANVEPFVGPLVAGAERFRDAWAGALNADIADIFRDLSGEIGPLMDGITGFATNAMPGLKEAVKASLPVLHALATELPGLGAAFGRMFYLIGQAGPGATMALSLSMKGLGVILVEAGRSLAMLSLMFETAIEGMAGMVHMMAKIPGAANWIKDLDRDTQEWLSHMGDVGQLDAATVAVSSLSQAFTGAHDAARKLFDELSGQEDANLRYASAVMDLKDALAENGAQWDINTRAGLDNNRMLKEAVDAAQGRYQAGQLTAEGYTAEIDKLIALAANAGASKEVLDRLAGRRYVVTVVTNYEVNGMPTAAWNEYRSGERSSTGRASGGIGGGLTMVGEQGRELVRLPQGSTVIPNGSTEAMMAGGAGGSSGMTVNFTGSPAPGLDTVLATWLMKQVRVGAIQLNVDGRRVQPG